MTYHLLPVPFQHAEATRPLWEPFCRQCAERDKVSPDGWIQRILDKEAVVLLIAKDNGEAVAAFAVEPSDESADVLWLGGKHPDRWFYLLPQFEEFARDALGCKRARIMMRPGFQRMFREQGYRTRAVVLERNFAG